MLFPLTQAKAISSQTATPFTLTYGNGCKFECLKTLRLLPEKRLVCYGNWQGHTAIAKVFFNQRHFQREITALEKLATADLPCTRILAQYSEADGKAFLLVTHYLSNNGDLQNAWQNAYSDQQQIDLLTSATQLIAAMHQAGCYQKDIHWGNFLLSENNNLHIIDTGQIIFGSLSEQERLNNLALFFAQIEPQYDCLISNAIKIYQAHYPKSNLTLGALIKEQRSYRIKKYAQKCLRNSTQFFAQQSWNQFTVINKSKSLLTHLDENKLNTLITDGQWLKNGNTATVVKANFDGKPLIIKRYNIKNSIHCIKRCLKSSRARRSWKNGHILKLLGINTAEPIALLEKRIGPIQLRSYLVTEHIEGISLADYVKALESEKTTIPDWLNQQLIQILTDLWRSKISHGDFKATNFLVANERLFIIDLDSMKIHSRINTLQRAIKKDKERFLKNWNGSTFLKFQALLEKI